MENHTSVTVFILAGLTEDPKLKIVLFIFLLPTYLLSISGNLVIITLTLLDSHLKSSMYFFLRNFSFLEISYTTVCIPILLVSMATGDKTISYNCCATQLFFAFLLWLAEGIFRIVRAIYMYDRITNAKVTSRVTKARMKLIISNTCVSVQEICKRGAVSQ